MRGDIEEVSKIESRYNLENEFEFSTEDYLLKQSLSLVHISTIARTCEERFLDRKIK